MRKHKKIFASIIIVLILGVSGWLSLNWRFRSRGPVMAPGSANASEMADHSRMPSMPRQSSSSTMAGMDMEGMDMEGMDMPSSDHGAHGTATSGTSKMETMPTAMISPEMQQLFGIRKGRPMMMELSKDLTSFGVVEYDESAIKYITTRYSGWITDIFADYTGTEVKEGDLLVRIYSPEIYTASEELLLAAQAYARLKDSGYTDVATGSRSLFEKAWRRLELLGLPVDQIQQIVDSGEPVKDLPVYATVSGTVIKKLVSLGSRVSPGDPLYQVADLTRLWLIASFYEADAPYIKVGQSATFTFDNLPGKEYSGRVSFIYPNLDPATRTIRVRFDLNVPNGLVRPGMFANVKLRLNLGSYLVVPEDAVMDTGVRQLVFLEMSEGHFMGHPVVVGPTANGYTAILSGISPNDTIALDSGFLLDAESKIRASMAGMEGMGH